MAVQTGAQQLEQTLPNYSGGEWRPWLTQVCDTIQRAAETAWAVRDLSARRDLSPQLAAAVRDTDFTQGLSSTTNATLRPVRRFGGFAPFTEILQFTGWLG